MLANGPHHKGYDDFNQNFAYRRNWISWSFCISELLRQGSRTVVLVRSNSRASAQKRIDEALSVFDLPSDIVRPIVLEANLSMPDLGLSRSDRDLLAAEPLHVIHSAASIRFHAEDPQGEPFLSNVGGTQNLLSLCRNWQVEKFNHVSTAYVQRQKTLGASSTDTNKLTERLLRTPQGQGMTTSTARYLLNSLLNDVNGSNKSASFDQVSWLVIWRRDTRRPFTVSMRLCKSERSLQKLMALMSTLVSYSGRPLDLTPTIRKISFL